MVSKRAATPLDCIGHLCALELAADVQCVLASKLAFAILCRLWFHLLRLTLMTKMVLQLPESQLDLTRRSGGDMQHMAAGRQAVHFHLEKRHVSEV